MTILDFSRLGRIKELADIAAVSFSMTYEEGSGEWYFTISSLVKAESLVSKSRPLNMAIDDALEWLESLTNTK